MTIEIDIIGAPKEEDISGKYIVAKVDNGKLFLHGIYEDAKEAALEACMGRRIGFRVMERGKACQETKQ